MDWWPPRGERGWIGEGGQFITDDGGGGVEEDERSFVFIIIIIITAMNIMAETGVPLSEGCPAGG